MNYFRINEWILYEDEQILVCHKPSGIAVQNARTGVMDLECAIKNYLAEKSPGKTPYLGIIHRLDQPVEGALVFGKTPRAAAELSRRLAGGEFGKNYLAVVSVKPARPEGVLEDALKKEGKSNYSRVVEKGTPGAKTARLSYKYLGELPGGSRYLLAVRLETGRHHQIRVQLAHAGMPIVGDRKYAPWDCSGLPLGLCCTELVFVHPFSGKEMRFQTKPRGAAFSKNSV